MPLIKKHFPGLDLDSPQTTALHRKLAEGKAPLRAWYEKQYAKYIRLTAGNVKGRHIELGSGGGFLKKSAPFVVTSSVLESDVKTGLADMLLDAQRMDLPSGSVDSFFMLDVLHHLTGPRDFFREADRCLKPGGFIFMIEPAVTPFSSFLYRNFHHEMFDPAAATWEHRHEGNLSDANLAVPHIIFERDRKVFMKEFPGFRISSIKKHTFIAYAATGGLTYEPLLPGPLYWLSSAVETLSVPLHPLLGTYMDVLIKK